jgi:hypothetical protein
MRKLKSKVEMQTLMDDAGILPRYPLDLKSLLIYLVLAIIYKNIL